jgi:hypothetical protein
MDTTDLVLQWCLENRYQARVDSWGIGFHIDNHTFRVDDTMISILKYKGMGNTTRVYIGHVSDPGFFGEFKKFLNDSGIRQWGA